MRYSSTSLIIILHLATYSAALLPHKFSSIVFSASSATRLSSYWRSCISSTKYPGTRFLTLSDPKMTNAKYEKYAMIAIEAVLKSCKIAAHIRKSLSSNQTMSKADASPVTIADLAVQTIIADSLYNSDIESKLILAEEDIENTPHNFLEKVAAKLNMRSDTAKEWDVERMKSLFKKTQLSEEMLSNPSFQGNPYWVLDPIDGTKGFLQKGGQYAIALAYMEEGVPVIGILGSPNLSHNLSTPIEGQGCIAFAIRNKGSKILYFDFLSDAVQIGNFSSDLFDKAERLQTSTPHNLPSIKVVESSDGSHSDQNFSAKIMTKVQLY
ncbi:hypothetical protein IE077_000697 [Cardiosporidium cionae]|uniref:3'(2'),5'-bisphosphate nucleotidase n=1 Tax=Cardiosporidium cionae TaxID=476202 RepID=A0ABQ7J6P9_9APIC|nr:hypothetical protein IE077_000697 [Cardiosporidium cionae]|eukprot:KAF8819664.1 hypothetical protein IE077_000697 [Cardiosporidium cionae]